MEDREQEYDDFIDEVYGETVTIAGYEYSTSRALKGLDPIAYRCGYADWLDQQEDDDE